MAVAAPAAPVESKTPGWANIGFISFIAGIITLIIGLSTQFSVINNGTSGQLTIETQMNTTLIPILIAFILGIVGYVCWIINAKDHNRYLQTFLMAFVSLIIGNVALVLSLYQVQVSST
jgi:vacuolar-type H+-ATPase subunit I/STV1